MKRRDFLQTTAAAVSAGFSVPQFIPSRALGLDDSVAPSERITLAVIGLGNRNQSNLAHFLAQEGVQCVAVCDCFADPREKGKQMFDNQTCCRCGPRGQDW